MEQKKSRKHIIIDGRIISSSSGRYVERLLTHLEKIDDRNKYTVLVPSKDIRYWKPKNPNFTIKVADHDNFSIGEQIGFCLMLTRLNPDLVHFCMPQQPVLYTGKRVTTFHDLTLLRTYNSDKNWLVYHIKQFIGRFVFWWVAQASKHLIVPTKFVRDDLAKFSGVSKSKITVTYEAAEMTSSKVEFYDVPFKKFILYVGAQSDYKNIKRLGDAHQKLLEKHPDLGLVLVGKMSEMHKRNEKYFKDKDYKNIHFTGFVKDSELNWLYANTSAYVFPSISEGFGLPALEAMTHNVPVASSNTTCLPEVYGDAAIYFNPLDTNEMAEKIDAVLTNKKLRKDMIEKGHQQVKKYSWERMAKQTLDIYNEVLKSSAER